MTHLCGRKSSKIECTSLDEYIVSCVNKLGVEADRLVLNIAPVILRIQISTLLID